LRVSLEYSPKIGSANAIGAMAGILEGVASGKEVGFAEAPGSVSRRVSGPTGHTVRADKKRIRISQNKRLVNASTREELLAAIRDAKSAGAPWQYLFESTVLYTIKTGDYSTLSFITPHLKEYVSEFSVNESLLFNSETEAAVFLHVFEASVDLNNGDKESALDNLRKANDLDPVALKEILQYAMTIQKNIKV
jgi:hypothetical protein